MKGWRWVGLLVACLPLSGFTSCQNYVRAREEADRRAGQMQRECDALKARTISFEEEHAFGGAVSVNWVSRGGGLCGKPDADELHQQLNKLGKNLAAQSSRPSLPWTFGVLESEGVNAVSGPGGYVFVSEGLLARLDNEAQLAGVLAHEIAHITGKHALREYHEYLVAQCNQTVLLERRRPEMETASVLVSQGAQRVAQGAAGSLQELTEALPAGELHTLFTGMSDPAKAFDFNKASKAFIQAITDQVIERLTQKGFRTEDEYAADIEAVELMAAAGYAPEEYVAVLAKLPERGLSTAHPRKEERQARLRAHLGTLRQPAPDGEFTSPVDLSRTRVVPLRDALHKRRAGTATRAE